ncbi:YdcF family protein [Epidermidibacterium keratini]|uniref:YdcF family protein n=1 Tax=Epidermidibacterium keratini TaxID=1891644 RepID=A0A7L4YSW9_9ACTN|nr:YdcF family protein [Epidermidibacterium keratini]
MAAAVFAALFAYGFWRDRRRTRNGVYLLLALCFGGLALLVEAGQRRPVGAEVAFMLVVLAVPAFAAILAIFLIINGVQMLRREGKSLANLLSLVVGGAIIGYLLIALLVLSRPQLPWIVQSLFVAMTMIVGYFGFLFVAYFAYSLIYRRVGYRPGVDYVVALGSGLMGERVPPLLASRLDTARETFLAERRTNPDVKIVVSGGQGPGEDIPEGVAMARYLREHDVPDDAIIIEDASRTTQQNLAFSKALMAARTPTFRAVVVTNDYHAFRAATYDRKARLRAQVIGAPTARYFVPSATIREFVAILAASIWVHVGVCLLLIAFAVLTR